MSQYPPVVPQSATELSLAIVIPVYNDWISFGRLVRDIDAETYDAVRGIDIVVVDDGSTEPVSYDFVGNLRLRQIRSITLVTLRCNLGHQRAIAVGLAQATQLKANAVVIMDADGEDRPRDIQLLIQKHISAPDVIVVASRVQRSESLIFRSSYSIYKLVFRLLTGQVIRFGNFSLVPLDLVNKLTHMPSLWNHYAATVLRSRLPMAQVPINRGRRYAGGSRMNYVSLVVHGLSALSVFSEAMLTRILLFFVAVSGIGALAAVGVVLLRLFTDLTAPGWASSVVGTVAVICLQALLLTMMSAIMALSSRSTFVPPPSGRAGDFIERVSSLLPSGRSAGSKSTADSGRANLAQEAPQHN